MTTTDGSRDMQLRPASFVAFKQWANAPVTAADVKLMLAKKDRPRDLLESLMKSNDPEVLDLAREALSRMT